MLILSMKGFALTCWAWLLLGIQPAIARAVIVDAPPAQINIVINDQLKQVFMGFGASQPGDQQRLFHRYGRERVIGLVNSVYDALGMNWVRLWVHSEADVGVELMKHRFYSGYVDNDYINILKGASPRNFLLAPTRGESPPGDSLDDYAEKLARFISDIRLERGVRIQATGIANEPAGFSAEQVSFTVKALRRHLDARGLADVAIIAPECASPDACATRAISVMKADAEAWRALAGVSTHSYNMGANKRVEALITGTDKQYWMTEAGRALMRKIDTAGRKILEEEEPGDTIEAATTAARFLNDMSHSVTHWFWFIGVGAFDQHPNKDSAQVLARPDDMTGGIKFNTKYFYLRQLRQTFDLGARFHAVTSTQPGRKTWDHGPKPVIVSAGASNPDGSWGFAVVNTTGLPDSKITKFHAATTYQVAITVPRAARGRSYQVFRSLPDGMAKGELVKPSQNGSISLHVRPLELLTLRSL